MTNDPKLSDETNAVYEKIARMYGWQTATETGLHNGQGVVHPQGLWAKTWKAAYQRFRVENGQLISEDFE